jgi:hypothetical protein
MIQQDELRNIALQAGLSKAEIDRIYGDAIDEADALGKGKDDDFVLQIVKIFAGLNEEDYLKTIENLNRRFIESGYTDLEKYLEDYWTGTVPISPMGKEGISSTDFAPANRPENNLGHAAKFPPEYIDDEDKEKKKKDEEI